MWIKVRKYIPNIITTIRLILAFVFLIAFIYHKYSLSLIIFLIAAISDLIDGYLARKWHAESHYGKLIDPLADRLLSGFAMILLSINIPLFYIPLAIEIIMMVIWTVGLINKRFIHVTMWGKLRTTVMFPTIIIGLYYLINSNVYNALYFLIGITAILQIGTAISHVKQIK